MSAKRVLFYSEGWGTGGIEAFVMNVMRSLSNDDVVFDVFCTHDYDDGYDTEIEEFGGTRQTVFKGEKPGLATRLKASTKAWRRILADQQYDAVHINTMNGMGFVYAAIAQEAGVPIRVVHSHNTAFGEGHPLVKGFAHKTGRALWSNAATHRLACSTEAGQYLFDDDSFQVVKNAFDIERYSYDEVRRKTIRKELGIDANALVVGNIGRLSDQKNPLFLVDIFAELHKDREDSYLLLIGQGPLEEQVNQRIAEAGIDSRVKRVSSTGDIPSYLSAMDAFCMPSRYEGLPIAPLEAQAAGLPVICSSSVSRELAETELVRFMDLATPVAGWAEAILQAEEEKNQDRSTPNETMLKTGYALPVLGQTLRDIYGLR